MEFWVVVFLFVFFTSFIDSSFSVQKKLNDYILNYEEIHYERDLLHQSHLKTKRSTSQSSPVKLNFPAFNRNFNLVLYPEKRIFSTSHKLEFTSRRAELVDTSFIYHGHDSNSPGSKVHGSIINGVFRGEVFIPHDTTYHIEAADKHNLAKKPSIIYRELDMKLDPYRKKREATKSSGGCAFDSAREWMNKVAHSAVDYNHPERFQRSVEDEDFFESNNKYSEKANVPHIRRKRSVETLSPNTCNLYLQVDPLFYDHVAFNTPDGTEKLEVQTRDEILAFFASHVNAITEIYSKTKFVERENQDKGYQGVNFQVQRTKIMTNKTELCGTPGATEYCRTNIDVSNFLNLNSKTNHSDFCLAYVFTYRDFTQGTLGLAWVGSPSSAAGGICEKHKSYNEGNTHVEKSLNTGIVTVVNFKKLVPPKVSQLTFAHEVGHNFGSPHDSGSLCAPYGTSQPGGNQGNYIMFPSATHGDKPHNSEFSPCSKDNITRVIDSIVKGRHSKVNCFQPSNQAFCGNGLVEDGEECDCGYAEDCLRRNDKCCHPKSSTEGPECALKHSTYNCSPTTGPCCTAECDYKPADSVKCRNKEDCSNASFCNGTAAVCPEPKKAADKTLCSDNTLICLEGQCRGSLCKKIDWEECFLTKTKGDSSRDTRLCYLSCQNPNTTECISSYDKTEVSKNPRFEDLLKDVSNSTDGVEVPAGSPCNNYRGYCDVFHRCRGVDADGPLARLKNIIFSPETFQDIKEWIVDHWWAVLLMALGLILFMGAFIKVCAVHTPTHNPNLKPARKLTLPRGQNRRRQPAPPQQELRGPPPPYSAGPSGAPPHGHGPRYNDDGRGGRGRDYMMKNV